MRSVSISLHIFAPFEIATVRQTLDRMLDLWEIPITSNAIENLVVHILIIVQRTKHKCPIRIEEKNQSIIMSVFKSIV